MARLRIRVLQQSRRPTMNLPHNGTLRCLNFLFLLRQVIQNFSSAPSPPQSQQKRRNQSRPGWISSPPQSGSTRAGNRGGGGCHLPPKQRSWRRKETWPAAPGRLQAPRLAGAEARQIATERKNTPTADEFGEESGKQGGRASGAEEESGEGSGGGPRERGMQEIGRAHV